MCDSVLTDYHTTLAQAKRLESLVDDPGTPDWSKPYLRKRLYKKRLKAKRIKRFLDHTPLDDDRRPA